MLSARRRVLSEIADAILHDPACVRVGVDGPDGSGKTVLAGELAGLLRERGRPVVAVSIDDFHHVRAIRYRRGRDSPEGFWLDSYDYGRFRADVLEPFAPGGSRRYRPAAHDLATDAVLDHAPRQAPPDAVLVVDGLFLHRDELAGAWDLSVFLDVPFTETARRMAARDGTPADPGHPGMRRYVEAQRIYFAACDPRRRASAVVDNSEVDAPRLTWSA
ncbi:uridine kinase [Actinoplanes sp. NEAU-A12]|uniref:Uridine kinase n=1 Tax=Actinoplanes sandaracinus TaxID=3045177 RepID=A0ABT6WMH7_9ACTN|nr:uridine kinase [Actinoplanes sandaracinus]MDI6100946.1 uridine kinase [Actinoplanes sandaracinus]